MRRHTGRYKSSAFAAVTLALISSSVLAADTSNSLGEGRSSVDDCGSGEPVCGIFSPDHLREFPDRCAAQKAGAEKVLAGPCFDAD